jgi:hypothetical protein
LIFHPILIMMRLTPCTAITREMKKKKIGAATRDDASRWERGMTAGGRYPENQ